MPTYQELATATSRIIEGGNRVNTFVNGGDTETFTTSQGEQPSIAKLILDFTNKSVRADIVQAFNSGQKTQARSNIGAADADVTVNLTGNQTVAGTKSFSTPIVSTGTPSADNHVLNRKQQELRKFLHLRPLDQWNIRERMDYFVNGGTASGSIGEWGWDSTGAISYGGSYSFPTGRTAVLATGSADNDRKAIFKPFTTAAERVSSLSCYFCVGFPADATCPINNGSVWVGWSNSLTPTSGYFLVGWDRDIGPNFLIRKKGDLEGAETVVDTGVVVPTGATFWPPHFVVDVVGNDMNNSYLDGGDFVRVVISGNTTAQDLVQLYAANITPPQAIYNSGGFASVATRTTQSKSAEIIGFEIKHATSLPTTKH